MSDLSIINANELNSIINPVTGQSVIMVDRATNQGLIIDYDVLAEAVISKLKSQSIGDDGLKFVVVGN